MLSNPPSNTGSYADKLELQHRLFAELSRMFGSEVPLYDKSLLVNRLCNLAVCDLLKQKHKGFQLSEEQLEKTSGERHGAIRIGTPEEYRWIAGFFAAFGMEPHNFYDMTSLGGKSQPIIATAFRSPLNPEHRVFTSLLMIESFAPETRKRIEDRLAQRQVFSDRARELVQKNEQQGGLSYDEADELVQEGTSRIFKWTGKAHDYQLYNDLCNSGFKIAADIACFESHHLNHLTPNTLCMDLYTAAMKFCLGESDAATFRHRTVKALNWLRSVADIHYMKLHFRHLTLQDIEAFDAGEVSDSFIASLSDKLIKELTSEELQLDQLNHSGFKDFTEGPSTDTPVLLRQDSYKALTEPVTFIENDGSTIEAVHTARFGEIEQRFYATTPKGRELYDRCLEQAETEREKNPGLAKADYDAYQEQYARAFAAFPKTLGRLLKDKLVFGRYSVSPKGSMQSPVTSSSLSELVDNGLVQYEGVRYEDFLPFSAAGIFASNLGQYGTKTVADKPVYTKKTLEDIMQRPVIDPNTIYRGIEADSILQVYQDLNIVNQVTPAEIEDLESAAAPYRAMVKPLPTQSTAAG